MKLRNENGFSLVELVMSTAVIGIIISFLGTAIYQILLFTEYGNNRLTAMHELQNAGYWFVRDGQSAVSATGGGTLSLTMSDNSSITYALTGNELRRSAGGAPMALARNITNADFVVTGSLATMTVTSSPNSRHQVSENETYRVYLRYDSE